MCVGRSSARRMRRSAGLRAMLSLVVRGRVLAMLPLVRGYWAASGGPRGWPRPSARALCTASPEFGALGLSPHLLEALSQMGIESPTQIQRLAWPVVRSGMDAVLLDETGTGKTLAYVLPILQAVVEEREALMMEALRDAKRAEAARAAEGNAPAPAPAGGYRLTLPRMPSQALLLAPNRGLFV